MPDLGLQTVRIDENVPISTTFSAQACVRDGDGVLYVVYVRSSPTDTILIKSRDDGATWGEIEIVSDGTLVRPVIAVKNNDDLAIGYSSGGVKYVIRNDVDDYGSELKAALEVTANRDVHFHYDSASTLHALWINSEQTQLRYGNDSLGFDVLGDNTWILKETVTTAPGSGDVIQYAHMLVDESNVPHAIWVNESDATRSGYHTIWYSNRSGGTWSTPEQVTNTLIANHEHSGAQTLALLNDGTPCAFVGSPTVSGIGRVFYVARTGGSWGTPAQVIDQETSTALIVFTGSHVWTAVNNQGVVYAILEGGLGGGQKHVIVRRNITGTFDVDETGTVGAFDLQNLGGWGVRPLVGGVRRSQPATGFFHVLQGDIDANNDYDLWFTEADLTLDLPEPKPTCSAEPTRASQVFQDEGFSEATLSLVPDLVYNVADRYVTEELPTEAGYVITNSMASDDRRVWQLQFVNRSKADRDTLLATLETLNVGRGVFTFTEPVSGDVIKAHFMGYEVEAVKISGSTSALGVYTVTLTAEELLITS